MDPLAERKFKNLRRRLDQLTYRQPLGIESVRTSPPALSRFRGVGANQRGALLCGETPLPPSAPAPAPAAPVPAPAARPSVGAGSRHTRVRLATSAAERNRARAPVHGGWSGLVLRLPPPLSPSPSLCAAPPQVPLVERLFSDLVHTTESLKNFKAKFSAKQKESVNVDDHIQPYVADNARLVKEVNQLHMELIRRKDAMDASAKKMKLTMRKVEHENADLRFLNTQYAHKLRVQEKDGEIKAERIQRLLEKNLKAVVETADGSKQHIATRRQRMEIKSLAEPALPPARAAKQLSLHEADLLRIADQKIEVLEGSTRTMKDERHLIESQLATLQGQVQQREDEIERLGRLLEGGRPIQSVLADSNTVKEQRKLAQLTNQASERSSGRSKLMQFADHLVHLYYPCPPPPHVKKGGVP